MKDASSGGGTGPTGVNPEDSWGQPPSIPKEVREGEKIDKQYFRTLPFFTVLVDGIQTVSPFFPNLGYCVIPQALLWVSLCIVIYLGKR